LRLTIHARIADLTRRSTDCVEQSQLSLLRRPLICRRLWVPERRCVSRRIGLFICSGACMGLHRISIARVHSLVSMGLGTALSKPGRGGQADIRQHSSYKRGTCCSILTEQTWTAIPYRRMSSAS
jgi:hypothetical protein